MEYWFAKGDLRQVMDYTRRNKKMKYISNGFAVSMVKGEAYMNIERITKDEFLAEMEDGYSIIGHPEIAEKYGLALNRESIKLNAGDTMYVVSLARRPNEGEVVSDGTTYNYEDNDDCYAYHRVTVISTAEYIR